MCLSLCATTFIGEAHGLKNNFIPGTSISRLCVHDENCKDGNEVSVKLTCDVDEKRLFEEALLWPMWKDDWSGGGEEERSGGHDHYFTIWRRRAHYGQAYSTLVALADSPSFSSIP